MWSVLGREGLYLLRIYRKFDVTTIEAYVVVLRSTGGFDMFALA